MSLLLFDLAAELLIMKLFVTADLLLHNALFEGSSLLDLLLLEQLDVLVLEVLVHASLLDLGILSRVLLLQLLVQLLLDESLSFAVTQDSLLLLLIVKQGIELLDGGPLVLLLDLRVDLSLSTLGSRPPALSIELFFPSGGCIFSSSSRKSRGTRYVRASH